jgi:hypothetical protein
MNKAEAGYYDRWQASEGKSIFREGDTTAEHQARRAELAARMGMRA